MVGYIGDAKYVGKEKIVVAMDIGTTHSAVSFAYLYPDDYARVRMVNKWPGQPESVGSSKACGSEALEYVEDRSYETAKWFKLHLHPPSMKVSNLPPPYGSTANSSTFEIPPLPSRVAVETVYTDFMKYLMGNTQACFEECIPNGRAVWQRLRETMVVVLTTPNGWDLGQQGTLRAAAIRAGLVKVGNAHELLDFVTEGEASVHYALAYSQSKTWLFPDSIFAVIDAGGSTVDSTLYECKATDPKVLLEEVCPSECVQAGGVFVDRAAETMFREKLQGSKFGDDESISDMAAAFESRTKRIFDGQQTSNVVDFGGSRDIDRQRGIIKGKLSLTRQEVEASFQDVIRRITESCSELLNGRNVQYIILVGGFGESPYLKKKLSELFNQDGAAIVTAEEPSKKAAAEGALIWFIKQTIMARVARTNLGVEIQIPYVPLNSEHAQRREQMFLDESGEQRMDGKFDVLVRKGQKLPGEFTRTKAYYILCKTVPAHLGTFSIDLLVWDGEGVSNWCSDSHGHRLPHMRTLCTLSADLSRLRDSLKHLEGPNGTYYQIEYEIVIRFGGTQLQSTLKWKEGEMLREGPVTIIPNAII